MFTVIKQYCISTGPAQVLDIISADNPNEYMVPIAAEKLPGRVETRGVNPVLICAHNLPFDRGNRALLAERFTALYRADEQFFSISYGGKKAALNILSTGKAHGLYKKMSHKMLPETFLFNFESYKDGLIRNQVISDERNIAEQEDREAGEGYRKNSALFVSPGSSL